MNWSKLNINFLLDHMHDNCRNETFQHELMDFLISLKEDKSNFENFVKELCNKSLKYAILNNHDLILNSYYDLSSDKTDLYIAIFESFLENKEISLFYAKKYNNPTLRSWNFFLSSNTLNEVINYWLKVNPPPLHVLIKKNKKHLIFKNIIFYRNDIIKLSKEFNYVSFPESIVYISEISIDSIKQASIFLSDIPTEIVYKPTNDICLVSLEKIEKDNYYFQCKKCNNHILNSDIFSDYYLSYGNSCPYCKSPFKNKIFKNSYDYLFFFLIFFYIIIFFLISVINF